MRNLRGFTLLELIIVVMVIAVLVAIAYPMYSRYGERARRADAKEAIMRVAAAQERYYTSRNKYASLATLGLGEESESKHYEISVTLENSDQSFTVTAAPKGVQLADGCGNLTYNNTQHKGASGSTTNGSCW
jgi:type IV pilus assembly protein PilE